MQPMELVYASESLDSVKSDIRPLLERQWEELAVFKDIPLDPDWAVYHAIDGAGNLAIFTARAGGVLIGYAVYFVRRHHHYRVVYAQNDIFWVDSDYRQSHVGSELLKFAEGQLAERGVGFVHTGTKTKHPLLAKLLLANGHEPFEQTFVKRLS